VVHAQSPVVQPSARVAQAISDLSAPPFETIALPTHALTVAVVPTLLAMERFHAIVPPDGPAALARLRLITVRLLPAHLPVRLHARPILPLKLVVHATVILATAVLTVLRF
jgi:hypothetical protein